MISELGCVIFSALDFGLKENEERTLTPGLDNLLDLMTSFGGMTFYYEEFFLAKLVRKTSDLDKNSFIDRLIIIVPNVYLGLLLELGLSIDLQEPLNESFSFEQRQLNVILMYLNLSATKSLLHSLS